MSDVNRLGSALETLAARFPAPLLERGEDACSTYGTDWLKEFPARPSAVAFPRSVDDVAALVKACRELAIPIVPSGGRTGLSGGAAATNGEVVISFEKMNRIFEVNPVDQTLRCEAGAVTQRIQETALAHGLYYPVDFASKGSSQIGGNIATNAGGIRVVKYGCTRAWVVGLKVVTGEGEVLELNGALFKNQTGYDFRHLVIGSEGTLALVVEATLKLTVKPDRVVRALCGLESASAALPVLRELRNGGADISAFEFFARSSLDKVIERFKLKEPFREKFPFYVLAEAELRRSESSERFEELVGGALENGLVSDAIVSQSDGQAEELLRYREAIPEALAALHTLHKNDISVPIPKVPEFVERLFELAERIYPDYAVTLFGHIGDGNLHLNVMKPQDVARDVFFEFCKNADHEVFRLVAECNGSVSAEHGVGLLKKEFLEYSRSKAEIELMRRVKAAFDPAGILNPGKIF